MGPTARGAHQFFVGLGKVRGVEGDEAHSAFADLFVDEFDVFLLHFAVLFVAPPEEDIGLGEIGFGDALAVVGDGAGKNAQPSRGLRAAATAARMPSG